jgi:hypothetical protein
MGRRSSPPAIAGRLVALALLVLGCGVLCGCVPRQIQFSPEHQGSLIGIERQAISNRSYDNHYARPVSYGRNYTIEMIAKGESRTFLLLRTNRFVDPGGVIASAQSIPPTFSGLDVSLYCRSQSRFDRLDRPIVGVIQEHEITGCHQAVGAWVVDLEKEEIRPIDAGKVECCLWNPDDE